MTNIKQGIWNSEFSQAALFMAALLFCIVCGGISFADDAVPNDPQPQWYRGNIHTHSLWSDGDDFPEMISEWYRTHDYHFLAISDHNILAQGQRWMKTTAIEKRGGKEALPKYLDRFGSDWVETRPIPSKSPETAEQQEVRLKPFNEYRSLIEERGKFILLQAEEITDSVAGKPVHMNATNIAEKIAPLSGETVPKAIEANLRAVEEQSKKFGREMLVHLNHPNFGYAITPEQLAEVVSERFFEVYNGHRAVNHLGDKKHPGMERMWDIANTLRLDKYHTPPLMGVATDDSHDYHGGDNSPGRGWIMVRARHLTPESLILAMKRGDFYASTGVTLREVEFDEETRMLRVEIEAEEGISYETRFIGTRKPTGERPGADVQVAPDAIGVVFHTTSETVATYQQKADELYIRAHVVSSRRHPNSSHADQKQSAWTQPVGWTADEVKK